MVEIYKVPWTGQSPKYAQKPLPKVYVVHSDRRTITALSQIVVITGIENQASTEPVEILSARRCRKPVRQSETTFRLHPSPGQAGLTPSCHRPQGEALN